MDDSNTVKDTGTAGVLGYNYGSCANRLPCGYCTLLGRLCPMGGNSPIEPTWRLPTQITCEDNPPSATYITQ